MEVAQPFRPVSLLASKISSQEKVNIYDPQSLLYFLPGYSCVQKTPMYYRDIQFSDVAIPGDEHLFSGCRILAISFSHYRAASV